MVTIRPSEKKKRIQSNLAKYMRERKRQREEFKANWITIYQNRELKIIAFEKVLEDILNCNKIKENESVDVYRCTIKINPLESSSLPNPKIHSFNVTVYKNMKNPKALVSLGNLPQPMMIYYPLDLLNAYYIVGKWNQRRDEIIFIYGKDVFEDYIKDIWNYFAKEMDDEGVPVDGKERRKLGITLFVPDQVISYVARHTGKTVKEVESLIENLPNEIMQETMSLGAWMKFQGSFKL